MIIYVTIPREGTVIALLISGLDLNFEIIKRADISRYGNNIDIRLVVLAPIALFCIFTSTTSSGKHLEGISHAHMICVMYKLISSSEDSDDLFFGFDRNWGKKQEKITKNKNIKDKYHLRIMLKVVFGCAENQEKTIYGLGWKKTLTIINDESVMDKAVVSEIKALESRIGSSRKHDCSYMDYYRVPAMG